MTENLRTKYDFTAIYLQYETEVFSLLRAILPKHSLVSQVETGRRMEIQLYIVSYSKYSEKNTGKFVIKNIAGIISLFDA